MILVKVYLVSNLYEWNSGMAYNYRFIFFVKSNIQFFYFMEYSVLLINKCDMFLSMKTETLQFAALIINYIFRIVLLCVKLLDFLFVKIYTSRIKRIIFPILNDIPVNFPVLLPRYKKLYCLRCSVIYLKDYFFN